jgi:hypothetical protein
MIRSLAGLAILALALMPLAAQDAPTTAPGTTPDKELSTAPYRKGDQAVSLSAGAMIPLAILGQTDSLKLNLGGSFGFSYRYFIGNELAIGGDIAGAFNGTLAGRSLFTAPLTFELSWWKTLVPFEFFVEGGLGGFIMRLDSRGMLGPFARVGGGAMWKTGSGWSIGAKAAAWFVPEVHAGDYAALTRYGLLLDTGLIAVYHL